MKGKDFRNDKFILHKTADFSDFTDSYWTFPDLEDEGFG